MSGLQTITATPMKEMLCVSHNLPAKLCTLSSQSFAIAMIANQSLSEGECSAQTIEHVARLAETLQHDLQQIADILLEAQSA